MDDRERYEDEEDDVEEGPPPPESLDHIMDELIDYKEERGEDLEVEWLPEDGVFRVVRGADGEVDIGVVEIDSAFYGENEAVVVEAEVGVLSEDTDLAELLRFAEGEMVFARVALAEGGEGEDLLVVQAASPMSQLAAAQLDGMIKEVAALSRELREEPPSETA